MARATGDDGRRRAPRRRWLRWVVLALAVAGVAVWMTRPTWYGVAVEVVRPTRGPVAETVVSSGRVMPPSKVAVSASLVSPVMAVHAAAGDRVKKGDVLIELLDDEAKAALVRAEATAAGLAAKRLDLAKRRTPVAAEALKQARASLAQAEADDARNRELAAGNAVGAAELERAATALALAKSKVRAAEIDVRAAGPMGPEEAALDAQEAELAAAVDAARVRLGLYRIVAPVDGVVLERAIEPGMTASPGAPLLVLAEAGPERLSIEPDEKNLGKLALGQPAVASADAFPERRFGAKLQWIASSVDPRRGTIEVRLAIDAPVDFLKSDMTVSVEIEVARAPDALTLPRAVVRDLATEAPWVMVVDGDRAAKVPVAIGLRGDDAVEIRSGLDASAMVIRPSPALPAIGAKVRVPDAATPAASTAAPAGGAR